MSNSQLVSEYAIALYDLGMENDVTAQIMEGLNLVKEVLHNNPEYYIFLDAPGIAMSERLASIHEAFAESIHEYVESFLCLLCRRGTVDIFPQCAEEYERIYNNRLNVAFAHVVSAVELTDDEKRRLDRNLEKRSGKQVEITYEIDPSLLGGMTVEMDGVIIDGSLRTRLKAMKEVMDK